MNVATTTIYSVTQKYDSDKVMLLILIFLMKKVMLYEQYYLLF